MDTPFRIRCTVARPTPLGLAALTPAPMTPEQVTDLVERTRAASDALRLRQTRTPRPRRVVPTTMTRVAARLVVLSRCSYGLAASALREVTGRPLSISGVQKAFRKLYPGETVMTMRRGASLNGFRAEHGWAPRLAHATRAERPVRDSASRRAALVVLDSGRSISEVASVFGLTRQAVHICLKRLRREASR